jgi:hypothetical protein
VLSYKRDGYLYRDKEGTDACINKEGMDSHINKEMMESHINKEWTGAQIDKKNVNLTFIYL